MKLRNDDVREVLLRRALKEFMVGLTEGELIDFHGWVLQQLEQNNGVKVKLPAYNSDDLTTIENLYNKFIDQTIQGVDKEYNKRRKVNRMVENTKDTVKCILQTHYETTGMFRKFTLAHLTFVFEYLYGVFYYPKNRGDTAQVRFQSLAYVLMVINECNQETLEYIVFDNIATGDVLLNTVYTGGIEDAFNG